MSRVFLSSDWHFNHEYVAGTRGFDTAEEHDEWLIESLNDVVTKRDHLWMLGDLNMGSLGEALEKVKRVNGIKHLVFGNHDAGHPMHRSSHAKQRRYLEAFESVSVHEQLKIRDRKVMLSHFPYVGDHDGREDRNVEWRLRDQGLWLACGHVHDTWGIRHRQINVGVDAQGVPVSTEQLYTMIQVMEEMYERQGVEGY